jgi:hypothetical protein
VGWRGAWCRGRRGRAWRARRATREALAREAPLHDIPAGFTTVNTAGAVREDDLAQQLERTARPRERGREVAVRFRLGELRRLGCPIDRPPANVRGSARQVLWAFGFAGLGVSGRPWDERAGVQIYPPLRICARAGRGGPPTGQDAHTIVNLRTFGSGPRCGAWRCGHRHFRDRPNVASS